MVAAQLITRRGFAGRLAVGGVVIGTSVRATEGGEPDFHFDTSGPRQQDFAPLVGKRFLIRNEQGRPSVVKLVEVKAYRRAPQPGHRKSFSLVFHAPTREPLSQDVYLVQRPGQDHQRLLLTPIGPVGRGNYMEAVFG